MDTRTIIGEFPVGSIMAKGEAGYSFPRVRLWIDQAGLAVPSDFKQAFPDRGTVYLWHTVCNGRSPSEYQFGFFSCALTNQGDATWSVLRVEDSLCEVVKTPTRVNSLLGFYEWLKSSLIALKTPVFGGNGSIYFQLAFCDLVVGPFVRSGVGYIPCTSGVYSWKVGEGIPVWGVSGEGPFFTDVKRHPVGLPFPPDAVTLVRKVCGLLDEGLAPGRAKLKALAEAVGKLQNTQLIPAAIQEVKDLLEGVAATLVNDQSLVSALMSNTLILEALETRWRQIHRDKQGQVDSLKAEVVAQTAKKLSLEQDIGRLDADLKNRGGEIGRLVEAEANAKLAAQDAFTKELGVLAADPARIAVLSNLISQVGSRPPPQKSTVFTLQALKASKWSLVERELALIGVGSACRKELAVVCHAAFISGQPIWIRSVFSDLIAKALLSCRGHEQLMAIEVPAGLLEPLIYPVDPTVRATVFHHANRSDISLVWAGIRERLFRQAIQPGDQMSDVVLTLEANQFLSVKQELSIGPVLDDAYLSFSGSKLLAEDSQVEVPVENTLPMDGVEFDEEIGAAMAALEPLKVSSFRMTCLLAFSALAAATKGGATEARRLLFKYWLLPRVDIRDAARVFQAHATEFSSDTVLRKLGEEVAQDGNE